MATAGRRAGRHDRRPGRRRRPGQSVAPTRPGAPDSRGRRTRLRMGGTQDGTPPVHRSGPRGCRARVRPGAADRRRDVRRRHHEHLLQRALRDKRPGLPERRGRADRLHGGRRRDRGSDVPWRAVPDHRGAHRHLDRADADRRTVRRLAPAEPRRQPVGRDRHRDRGRRNARRRLRRDPQPVGADRPALRLELRGGRHLQHRGLRQRHPAGTAGHGHIGPGLGHRRRLRPGGKRVLGAVRSPDHRRVPAAGTPARQPGAPPPHGQGHRHHYTPR